MLQALLSCEFDKLLSTKNLINLLFSSKSLFLIKYNFIKFKSPILIK